VIYRRAEERIDGSISGIVYLSYIEARLDSAPTIVVLSRALPKYLRLFAMCPRNATCFCSNRRLVSALARCLSVSSGRRSVAGNARPWLNWRQSINQSLVY